MEAAKTSRGLLIGCVVAAVLAAGPLTSLTGLHGPLRWLVGGVIGGALGWLFYVAAARIAGRAAPKP